MLDDLLDRMTLEEQVSLLSGADFWTTAAIERLGIAKIKVTDGPNGARGSGSLVGGIKSACFPAAISLGASWNTDLVREMGKALAEEAKSKGARVVLAPTVNIQRSGLNGRNFECYSEDPHLTSEIAVGYIDGLQGEGVAATIKHLVGNESEVERYTMSSDIDERALREIYLPPFEAAVKRAKVMAMMSSYNRLNGTPTSEHKWLLTKVLREQWGFEGIVMSDWFGSHTTVETVNAGLDLEMPGPYRDRGEKLIQAVQEGKVDPQTVRVSARRVLVLLERLGAFTDPSMHEERAEDRPEHRALIRKLGNEGAVLLKNDGVLPVDFTALKRVAVIGPNAAEARVMGGGSAQINAHYRISPLEGLREAFGSEKFAHSVGAQNNRLIRVFPGPFSVELFKNRDWKGPAVAQPETASGEVWWFGDMPEGIDRDDFSARISGSYTPEESGEHILSLTTAGLGKLFVDGELIVNSDDGWTNGDNFTGLGNSEVRKPLVLKAGRTYAITVEFRSLVTPQEGISFSALRFGVEKPLGDDALEAAVRLAADSDVAIVFAGRQSEWDVEGLDLPDLGLPGRQDELIKRVAAANPRTIVVLQTGGPVVMPWLDDVSAVLQMWYPGQELGNCVADILSGAACPGGRLPQTFPHALTDNSAITEDRRTYPGKDGHVGYSEGIYVGYRHHDTRNISPLFPFGFGLAYTSFEWSEPYLSSHDMMDDGITVDVDVTNVGARAGADVVQLYVRALESDVDRPDKELRAFGKIHLEPGRSGKVSLTISSRDLSYYDVDAGAFVAQAGRYELVLAASATDAKHKVVVRLADDYEERP
ncbi:beta-glucosidase [Agrobacterium rhizogenes]|uniref:beta-glucosidase n=1 Tax=Rhizobium rhizogenes TaxID=359 RepID=UPI0015721D19|nr:glycoside hydrolase family 3 C-terminal domain-containing protein [Rhizobium rhizogenes]NTI63682.1 beta-glucosidase [Rhizobium rhizogenes]